MSGSGVRPFQVAVGDDVLDDLQSRLERVRWPDEVPGAEGSWTYGTDLGYLQELVAYWRDGYDWRAQEKAINEFPQFRAEGRAGGGGGGQTRGARVNGGVWWGGWGWEGAGAVGVVGDRGSV